MKDLVEQSLPSESRIVWTEDISELDYVRQRFNCYASHRVGGMAFRSLGRRVGYAELLPGTPRNNMGRWWVRREFWVSHDDRQAQPNGAYKLGTPFEGVDPRTIAPGILGVLTERAWGGPLPAIVHLNRYVGE